MKGYRKAGYDLCSKKLVDCETEGHIDMELMGKKMTLTICFPWVTVAEYEEQLIFIFKCSGESQLCLKIPVTLKVGLGQKLIFDQIDFFLTINVLLPISGVCQKKHQNICF